MTLRGLMLHPGEAPGEAVLRARLEYLEEVGKLRHTRGHWAECGQPRPTGPVPHAALVPAPYPCAGAAPVRLSRSRIRPTGDQRPRSAAPAAKLPPGPRGACWTGCARWLHHGHPGHLGSQGSEGDTPGSPAGAGAHSVGDSDVGPTLPAWRLSEVRCADEVSEISACAALWCTTDTHPGRRLRRSEYDSDIRSRRAPPSTTPQPSVCSGHRCLVRDVHTRDQAEKSRE